MEAPGGGLHIRLRHLTARCDGLAFGESQDKATAFNENQRMAARVSGFAKPGRRVFNFGSATVEASHVAENTVRDVWDLFNKALREEFLVLRRSLQHEYVAAKLWKFDSVRKLPNCLPGINPKTLFFCIWKVAYKLYQVQETIKHSA